MKATGIVRRIDDLGRVVIPKEIRRTLRIREGDPLEIYTDNGGEVIFKKYSPMGEMSTFSAVCAEVLAKTTGLPALICDTDGVIAAGGISKKEVLDRRVAPALEQLGEGRKNYLWEKGGEVLRPVEGLERQARTASPILSNGDVVGYAVLLQGDGTASATEAECKLTVAGAAFLGRQIEG